MTPIHHFLVHTKPFSFIPLLLLFISAQKRLVDNFFIMIPSPISFFVCCCCCSFFSNPSSSSQFSCYFSFSSFFFVMCQLIVNLFRLLLLLCFSRCFSTMLFQRAVCRYSCCSSSLDIRYNYENVYNILFFYVVLPCFSFSF